MSDSSAPGRRKVIVLFGGRSAEHEVSCTSAVAVLRALDTSRYDIVPIGVTHTGTWVRSDSAQKMLDSRAGAGLAELPRQVEAVGPSIDATVAIEVVDADDVPVVLPILHGPFGEDGTVQGMLELAGVPYVGSGVLGSALSMDKGTAKRVLAAEGIPQARFLVRAAWELDGQQPFEQLCADVESELSWPVFVKPANLGSSVGVSKAESPPALRVALDLALGFDEWVVLEESISGREIEFAVLGNEAPVVSVAGEVIPGDEFYSYEDKYLDNTAQYRIPAPLDADVLAEGQRIAAATYTALRCEGMARIDFFLEERRGWLVNEANTIPGFTPISMYPKLWEASGLPYPELLDRLIELAVARHRRRSGKIGRAR